MEFDTTAIERLPNGRYAVRLTAKERELLSGLPHELVKQLEAADDDGSIFRLFPPGYSQDLGRQFEFDRLMRDDLQAHHVDALRVLAATAHATELDQEELGAWIRALNQLRLVLGTRLDVSDDSTDDDFPFNDPRAAAYNLYIYMGCLQDQAVDALTEAL